VIFEEEDVGCQISEERVLQWGLQRAQLVQVDRLSRLSKKL